MNNPTKPDAPNAKSAPRDAEMMLRFGASVGIPRSPRVTDLGVIDPTSGVPYVVVPEGVLSHAGLGCMPRVLDPCCGSRMMWFDRQHPDVVFGDQRSETITVTDRSNGRENGTRTLRIEPDALLDFRALPYPDESFRLVAFDPPHLHTAGPRSWLAAKYGKLGENWRDDLRQGFAECFRVLHPDGVLVFKWNECQVKIGGVLALTPVQPGFHEAQRPA